jgi:hypothetical protein
MLWLLLAAEEVSAAKVPTPVAPTAIFDTSAGALDQNTTLLADCNGDLAKFLDSQPGKTVDCGTEFWLLHQIVKDMLGNTPNSNYFGISWRMA